MLREKVVLRMGWEDIDMERLLLSRFFGGKSMHNMVLWEEILASKHQAFGGIGHGISRRVLHVTD